jgi:hypothetical protein
VSEVEARWYPAQVRLPDGRLLQRVMVVVARGGDQSGLTIFDRPDRVVYHAAVSWLDQPPLPRTQRAARNGVELCLAGGDVVVVTPGAACKCGALGRWAGPDWARTVGARA